MTFITKKQLTTEFSTTHIPLQTYNLSFPGRFTHGSPALQLTHPVEGLWARLSLEVPEFPAPYGYMWVKSYGENDGVQQELIARNFIEPTPWKYADSGIVLIPMHKLAGDLLRLYQSVFPQQ